MTVKQITNNIKRIIIWKFVLPWLLNNYYVCRFIDRLKVKPQYSGLILKVTELRLLKGYRALQCQRLFEQFVVLLKDDGKLWW